MAISDVGRMTRLLVLTLALPLGLLLAAGSAKHVSAAETHTNCATFDHNGNVISVTPNCSETFSSQGGPPQAMPTQNPCTGDSGILTLYTTHQIFHVNVDGAGDLWLTGTQDGTATFVPDSPLAASAAGAWASWFGGSINARNLVLSDTFNITLHSSSGQTITFHEPSHIVFSGSNPIVPVTTFDKPMGTCS